MASRAAGNLRSMILSRMAVGNRQFVTSTPPKTKAYSQNMESAESGKQKRSSWALKAEWAPIYMVMGFVVVAVTMACHTAKQNLVHGPAIHFSKKRRGSVPEVEDPDRVVASADKFINKSFLRKVGQIQEQDNIMPAPPRPNPFTKPRNAESLKSVGINPSRQ